MHGPEIVPPSAATTPEDVNGVLNFLWLELTNRCNLQCIHCYTEFWSSYGRRRHPDP